MCDLFAKDAERFDKFSLKFNDILLDYSKNRITDETFKLLLGADQAKPSSKSGSPRCLTGRRSISPKIGRCCILRFAIDRIGRSLSMAMM